jgi:hypothetical protein
MFTAFHEIFMRNSIVSRCGYSTQRRHLASDEALKPERQRAARPGRSWTTAPQSIKDVHTTAQQQRVVYTKHQTVIDPGTRSGIRCSRS